MPCRRQGGDVSFAASAPQGGGGGGGGETLHYKE